MYFILMCFTIFCVSYALNRLVFRILFSRTFLALCNMLLILALIVGIIVVLQLMASR